MIFDNVKKELLQKIGESEYNKFIADLTYNEKKSKSNLCIIETSNPLIANWIKTKYSDKIADVFESLTKIKPSVEILVINKKQSQKTLKEKLTLENKMAKNTKLNPSYKFENFVVGPSNEFAYSIAQNVIKNPVAYNPVFIYGGVGLGKTHLLHAIGNCFDPKEKVIIYITAEQFMNDFIHHLTNKTMDSFREKYRTCDLFLIDDVQFLSNKEGTQEEFFHTFEELYKNNKQIVLTADKFPKQIAGLEDRLSSRFSWGQTANIQAPELETKIAIIKKKCEIDQINLDNEIINYIATNIHDSIREIEGIIIKLNAYSKMIGKPISLEISKEILKDHIKEKKESISIDEIIKTVSNEFNIKPSEIKSKSRVNSIVIARRMVFYLTRKLTQNSMPTIAKYFSMKDHSAVSKALKKIDEMIVTDADFKNKLDLISNKISSKE